MTRVGKMWAVAVLAAAAHTGPATAQATDAATEDVRETVTKRAAVEVDQATLRAFLRRMRSGGTQEDMSLGLRRAETLTPSLDPFGVESFDSHERNVETARNRIDDKVVIPTTTLIIGLLVLIVILVAD